MANSDPTTALQVNGRLCWNPTDLSTAFPHGGTALGFMKGHHLQKLSGQHRVWAEELDVAVETIRHGREYLFQAILAGWDADALGSAFEDVATGSVTGRAVVQSRPSVDGVRGGKPGSDLAGKLYFSPDADTNPGVLFYSAIPMEQDDSSWQFRNAEAFGIPLRWLAVPDANWRHVAVGLREDLTL